MEQNRRATNVAYIICFRFASVGRWKYYFYRTTVLKLVIAQIVKSSTSLQTCRSKKQETPALASMARDDSPAARRPQQHGGQCAVKWDRNLKPKLAIMRQCTSVTNRRTDGLVSSHKREMYIWHLALKTTRETVSPNDGVWDLRDFVVLISIAASNWAIRLRRAIRGRRIIRTMETGGVARAN